MLSTRTTRRSALQLAAGLTVALVTAPPARARTPIFDPFGDQGGVGIWGSMPLPQSIVARADILAHAESWIGKGLLYSSTGFYGRYRTDSSGYASMAWDLETSLDTTTFIPYGIATVIAKDQLQAGDALLNDAPGSAGHVVLFDSWTDSSRTSYLGYEFTPAGVQHHAIPYPYLPDRGTFRPVRANWAAGSLSTSLAPNEFVHNIRLANGSWTPYLQLLGIGSAPTFNGPETAIAGMPNGSAQVLGIGNDGNVYHQIRSANGQWSGFATLDGVGTPTMQASKVAIAAMPDGTSQVLAIGNDGNIYHQTRLTSGSWTGFAPLNGVGTPTMQAREVAITGLPDGTSQVLAIGNDGNVYHERRLTDGSWTGFAPLAGLNGAGAMQAGKIGIAGLPDGTAQAVVTGSDGNIYHQIRLNSGSWTGFVALNGYDGAPMMWAGSIGITGLPDGTAQVIAVGNDGNVYHEVRFTSGSWAGFAPVQGYALAPALPGVRVAITGMPDGSSHMVVAAR
ncbi:hypothetical protein KCMC57_up18700 [Kitasatospora sp. CMC57]|uniref:PLL-like beta propeller domain-containing protein n=1 Tax=Kitasatospora sp. CMC57 TaxID=3231513 RepID=A0AB33JW03_9ACTN